MSHRTTSTAVPRRATLWQVMIFCRDSGRTNLLQWYPRGKRKNFNWKSIHWGNRRRRTEHAFDFNSVRLIWQLYVRCVAGRCRFSQRPPTGACRRLAWWQRSEPCHYYLRAVSWSHEKKSPQKKASGAHTQLEWLCFGTICIHTVVLSIFFTRWQTWEYANVS